MPQQPYNGIDPVEDFDQAVRDVLARGQVSRQQAVKYVKKHNPGLWQTYLLATNPDNRRQRLLKEKFELETAGG